MPFVHLERELWDMRDAAGREIAPDAPERRDWLLERGAVGRLHAAVEQLLADPGTLAASVRLLLDRHFTPVLAELICAAGSRRRCCARTRTSARCAGSTVRSAATVVGITEDRRICVSGLYVHLLASPAGLQRHHVTVTRPGGHAEAARRIRSWEGRGRGAHGPCLSRGRVVQAPNAVMPIPVAQRERCISRAKLLRSGTTTGASAAPPSTEPLSRFPR
jgi:hypothetical protein